MVERCFWCTDDPQYVAYHDQEWGRPSRDETHLFEMLSLELFQSGLSWLTILRKRAGFRQAFANWNVDTLAGWGEAEQDRLLLDPAIVRNRAKIRAVLNNARRLADLQKKHGSLAEFLQKFVPQRTVPAGGFDRESLPLLLPEAHAMAAALRSLGFSFTGPMVCMSLMQAVGIVNDHLRGCFLCPY
jgi:DNA-3-methyladenine glycosylase I